ncbi:hypothetical protein Hanom_Chr07g00626161 [Helianthus anomalus]
MLEILGFPQEEDAEKRKMNCGCVRVMFEGNEVFRVLLLIYTHSVSSGLGPRAR